LLFINMLPLVLRGCPLGVDSAVIVSCQRRLIVSISCLSIRPSLVLISHHRKLLMGSLWTGVIVFFLKKQIAVFVVIQTRMLRYYIRLRTLTIVYYLHSAFCVHSAHTHNQSQVKTDCETTNWGK